MGQTSAWALPFPDGTDRPCDTPQVLGRLADRLRTVFDTFDASLSVVQLRPATMVSFQSTVAQVLTNQNPRVQFSTVEHDNTGQMVDLARRADRITFNRTALWAIGGQLVGTTGTAGNVVEVSVSAQGINPTQSFSDDQRDGAAPDGELFTTGGFARVNIASGWMDFAYTGVIPLNVTAAAMWAFWIADL